MAEGDFLLQNKYLQLEKSKFMVQDWSKDGWGFTGESVPHFPPPRNPGTGGHSRHFPPRLNYTHFLKQKLHIFGLDANLKLTISVE